MGWMTWFLCTIAFLALGGALMRSGRTGIVKIYIGACLVFFLMTMFKFGHLFGAAFAPVPWVLCTALVPAIAILAFVSIRRDRAEVLGTSGGREATASAAILYGAGATHDGVAGGGDVSGGAEM